MNKIVSRSLMTRVRDSSSERSRSAVPTARTGTLELTKKEEW